jgi:uncharacterized protein YeaO (DUF488 family)
MITVKSILSKVADDDGFRVLVEPVRPGNACIGTKVLDIWLPYLAPTPELFIRYSGDLISWEDFVSRYHGELEDKRESLRDLQAHRRYSRLTLLHGSCNEDRNSAVALKMFLENNDPETGSSEWSEPAFAPFMHPDWFARVLLHPGFPKTLNSVFEKP